jgi:hypothetical protein
MVQRNSRTGHKEPSDYHKDKDRIYESYIIEKRDITDCPFSNTKLTVVNILWACKETEQDIRIRMNIARTYEAKDERVCSN